MILLLVPMTEHLRQSESLRKNPNPVKTFIRKVLDELRDHGYDIDPKDAKGKKDKLPGALTLDNDDGHILLALPNKILIAFWQATKTSYYWYNFSWTVLCCQWFKFTIVATPDYRNVVV